MTQPVSPLFSMMELSTIGVLSLVWLIGAAVANAGGAIIADPPRSRLQALDKDGNRAAGHVLRLLKTADATITSTLIIKSVCQCAFVASLILPFYAVLGIRGAAAATALSAASLFVFSEAIPRALVRQYPEQMALALGTIAGLVRFVLRPVAVISERLVQPMMRAFGLVRQGKIEEEEAHAEIREAIDLHHEQGSVEASDRHMLGGILDLKELRIADVMIHRANMIMLDADQPADRLLERIIMQPYTRLPLYRGEQDNIVGILNTKDILRALARARGNVAGINILALAARPWFVPETTLLADQLRAFLQRRSHFALVVDEYGVLQGLITLEDILEEIVGEIRDEHDLPISGVRPQADVHSVVRGFLELDAAVTPVMGGPGRNG
ncbi:MAG TPA: hypothetical protein DCL48_04815, partial [Alphaproteobacteria bacterium]|nr:hypothetical protein [Alphaproteobacteria bacterium]